MPDNNPPPPADELPAIDLDDGRTAIAAVFIGGVSFVMTLTHLSALLAALTPSQRESVLAPFAGELGQLLLAEQARRHADSFARQDAEDRAVTADMKRAEAERERDEARARISIATDVLRALVSASPPEHTAASERLILARAALDALTASPPAAPLPRSRESGGGGPEKPERP